MSLEARRQEEKAERRRAILDAAERVATRRGFDDLTMSAVAEEARLSRSLLYVYFNDLDDIVMGVTLRALRALRRRFERAAGQHDAGLDRIRAVGEAYVAFYHAEPDYFEALARFEARDLDPAQAESNEARALAEGNGILALMADVIADGVADGSIRADLGDPMATAVALWGYTHGMIQVAAKKETMLLRLHGLDMDGLITHGLDMAGRGLCAPDMLHRLAEKGGA